MIFRKVSSARNLRFFLDNSAVLVHNHWLACAMGVVNEVILKIAEQHWNVDHLLLLRLVFLLNSIELFSKVADNFFLTRSLVFGRMNLLLFHFFWLFFLESLQDFAYFFLAHHALVARFYHQESSSFSECESFCHLSTTVTRYVTCGVLNVLYWVERL